MQVTLTPEVYSSTGYDEIDRGFQTEAPKSTNLLTYKALSDPIDTKLGSVRTGSMAQPGQVVLADFDFWTIANAYYLDSYLSSAIDKYIHLVSKEGWEIKGKNTQAVDYIKLRLRMHQITSDKTFEALLSDIEFTTVLFANAFLIKVPFKGTNPIPGLKLTPFGKAKPVGGYFTVHPGMLQPVVTDKGIIESWVYSVAGQERARFKPEEVIHIAYGKAPNTLYGQPYFLAAIEDIRSYRQLEYLTVMLINRYIHPIIHVRKGIDGSGKIITGRTIESEDIQETDQLLRDMTVDGILVTPPDVDIKVLGVESQALRAEGYLDIWRKRVFAGLATSDTAMGETPAGEKSITEVMHDMAKAFQKVIAQTINSQIIFQMLFEGGFDPIQNEDEAHFEYNSISLDEDIKEKTEYIAEWFSGALTLDEYREFLGKEPLVDADLAKTYFAISASLAAQYGPQVQSPAQGTTDNKLRPAGIAGTKSSPKGGVIRKNSEEDEDE